MDADVGEVASDFSSRAEERARFQDVPVLNMCRSRGELILLRTFLVGVDDGLRVLFVA